MANKPTEQQDPGAQVAAKASTRDLVTEIGTLTYPRAVKNFGKDNALKVMHRVAEIGGHGMFPDEAFTSPLFGGLGMPDIALTIEPNKAEFAKYGENADFFYGQAVEQHEQLKQQLTERRAAINDLYISMAV